ncbi:MAG: hypothetical protein J6P60_06730 [Lachnospiraceae bacterium]|nr:hypothetical protein [Lachnospiraceae bacterium]
MEYVAILFVVFIVIAAFLIGGIVNERRSKLRFMKKLCDGYGKPSDKQYPDGRMDTVRGYCDRAASGFTLDDITWNDLDMDRVFRMLDFTLSAAGEEVLYTMLRAPRMEDDFERFEELVTYFMENEKERIALQVLFAGIGRTGKYSVFDYLDGLDLLGERSSLRDLLCIGAIFASAGLCFFSGSWGAFFVVISVFASMYDYFSKKRDILPYLTTFSYLLRLLDVIPRLEKLRVAKIDAETGTLNACYRSCRKFYKGAYLVTSMNQVSSDPFGIVMDYIRMIFHVDLLKFNQMLRQVQLHKDDFVTAFATLGRLEAYISVGAYRSSVPDCTIPVFREASGTIRGEEMVHPLIEDPVANSFTADRGILLTGSNASGKSTFLKMVAVNAVMAQSVHTVRAAHYEAPMVRVYTSMALRDDLAGGDSYFIVEIQAIKMILDAKKQPGTPVHCFVDEVLRGTNTVERIAAACEILRNLEGNGSICFAATHDIELTTLLGDEFDNYHFEETVEKEDIFFNYRLMPGSAKTRNAIRLLQILGFGDAIIQKADQRANQFVKEGVWKR